MAVCRISLKTAQVAFLRSLPPTVALLLEKQPLFEFCVRKALELKMQDFCSHQMVLIGKLRNKKVTDTWAFPQRKVSVK